MFFFSKLQKTSSCCKMKFNSHRNLCFHCLIIIEFDFNELISFQKIFFCASHPLKVVLRIVQYFWQKQFLREAEPCKLQKLNQSSDFNHILFLTKNYHIRNNISFPSKSRCFITKVKKVSMVLDGYFPVTFLIFPKFC